MSVDLSKFKLHELKEIAREYKDHIKINYSNMKKNELVDALNKHILINNNMIYFKKPNPIDVPDLSKKEQVKQKKDDPVEKMKQILKNKKANINDKMDISDFKEDLQKGWMTKQEVQDEQIKGLKRELTKIQKLETDFKNVGMEKQYQELIKTIDRNLKKLNPNNLISNVQKDPNSFYLEDFVFVKGNDTLGYNEVFYNNISQLMKLNNINENDLKQMTYKKEIKFVLNKNGYITPKSLINFILNYIKKNLNENHNLHILDQDSTFGLIVKNIIEYLGKNINNISINEPEMFNLLKEVLFGVNIYKTTFKDLDIPKQDIIIINPNKNISSNSSYDNLVKRGIELLKSNGKLIIIIPENIKISKNNKLNLLGSLNEYKKFEKKSYENYKSVPINKKFLIWEFVKK